MVERTVSLGGSGADIAALKEMIYAQQELLQKLHAELDTEREASSTSTNEALSMILKLQGEKAALTMEASQYKRMAEEKMCHAETSLALFEDLIYQKEMEIASLEFQVQSYRCKLLSLGCDPGAGENKFPENLMLQTNGKGSTIRRLQSLPAIGLDDSYENKDAIEGEKPLLPMLDFVPQDKELGVDESLDPKKPLEDSDVRDIDSCWELIRKNSRDGNLNSRWDTGKENVEHPYEEDVKPKKKNPEQSYGGEMVSYWDEINKLDDRVREISDLKDDRSDNNKYTKLKRESRSRLLVSQVSTSILESTRSEITINLEKMKKSDKLLSREASVGAINSSSIHDIFEVPNSMQKGKYSSDEDRFDFEDRLGKPDLVVEELIEPNAEKAAALVRVNNERRRFAKPPRDLASGGRRKNIARTTTSIVDYQAEIQNLNSRIEQLEGNRINMTNEISGGVGGAWMLLLKEINEKVNSIQSEIRSWRPNESSPQEEEALNSIKEAMLYFWF